MSLKRGDQSAFLVGVTGANGFLGLSLVLALRELGCQVRSIVRSGRGMDTVAVGDIGPTTDWNEALKDVDVVVHCAARVHVMRETAEDPQDAFDSVNVVGTQRLADAAIEAGVRRVVFLSTIKVNGERTTGRAFLATDTPAPQDPYARSKLSAERVLQSLDESGALETVIIRPPLVYGSGARGNFQRLVAWVQSGRPLPFALIRNRRSLVGIDNLVDLIVQCVDNPQASGQTFLVSDGHDLSTPDLVGAIAAASGRSPRLVPIPPMMLRAVGALFGRSAQIERLTGSLEVDLRHTTDRLGWRPKYSVEHQMQKAVTGC